MRVGESFGKRSGPKRGNPTENPDWKELGVHPAFVRFAELYRGDIKRLRRIEGAKLPVDRLNAEKRRLMDQISQLLDKDVRPLMPESIKELAGLDVFYGICSEVLHFPEGEALDPAICVSIGVMEFDAHNRFHRPLQNIMRGHYSGDAPSTCAHQAIELNHQKVRYGAGLPPFRGNIDHRIIMQVGLGLGLENLSWTKLEDFYNQFCPCEVLDHDSNDLGRLKKRILEEAEEARASLVPKFCGVNQLLSRD